MMLEYGKSVELVVEILASGTHWSESLRLTKQSKNENILETIIMPAAQKALQSMHTDITEMHDTFAKQKVRLAEVRIRKAKHKGSFILTLSRVYI
jgi:hypothetical protein